MARECWRQDASGVMEIIDSDDEPSEPPRPVPQRSEPRARPAEVRERDERKEDAAPRAHAAGGNATLAFGQRTPAARDPPRPPAQEPMRREPVRAEHLDDSAAPVNDGAREGERLQGGGLQGGGSSSTPAAGVPREGAVNSKAVVFKEDERARLALRAQQEGQEMGKQNEPERSELDAARAKTADFEQQNARLLSDLEKKGEEIQQKDQELTGTLGLMEQERAELRMIISSCTRGPL